MRPIVYDLFCGLGGWSEGFLAEGYECIGFDIERHDYGSGGYPGTLIMRDVRSIHGSELKDATCIVASPPCQAYSYRAMPWKRAKALPPPDNELFNACFRIQREAIEAAGHHIPLIVENVCGAQKWVGRARWHFGSYYLWGDLPALMPVVLSRSVMKRGVAHRANGETNFHGRKVPGIKLNEVGFNVAAAQRYREGQKGVSHAPVGHWTNPREANGVKFSQSGDSRKAASAMIAKIPFPLAVHIARTFRPRTIDSKRNTA